MIEKIDGLKTQEKMELKSEEMKSETELALGDGPLKNPIESFTGETMSAPQLGVLIKKLEDRQTNTSGEGNKLDDQREKIKAKINELAKLKLKKEQDELKSMKEVLHDRHKEIQ